MRHRTNIFGNAVTGQSPQYTGQVLRSRTMRWRHTISIIYWFNNSIQPSAYSRWCIVAAPLRASRSKSTADDNHDLAADPTDKPRNMCKFVTTVRLLVFTPDAQVPSGRPGYLGRQPCQCCHELGSLRRPGCLIHFEPHSTTCPYINEVPLSLSRPARLDRL